MRRRFVVAGIVVVPLLAASTIGAAQSAKSLAGAYSGVSFATTDASGKTTQVFGENPRAMMLLTPDGRYSIVVMRASLPKFAAGNRNKGSAEENQAVVAGSLAHFGRYTVDESEKTITFHVEGSTFPNWDGQAQKRPYTVSGDRLTYKVPAASVGGSAEVVWKRVGPAH